MGVGLLTALLTAFYMSRQVFMTFFGEYRYAEVRPEEISGLGNRVTTAEPRWPRPRPVSAPPKRAS